MNEMSRTETWAPIPGWEKQYEVSTEGRVKSLKRNLILQPILKPNGYLAVNLKASGRVSQEKIHRLVLTAFVGPAPEEADGCHNNGVRDDNRLENLRWDTRKGNQADRYDHGTVLFGKDNPATKLTKAMVQAIKGSMKSQDALAAEFGVAKTTIRKIQSGKTWAHVQVAPTLAETQGTNAAAGNADAVPAEFYSKFGGPELCAAILERATSTAGNAAGLSSGCRMTGGICACRSGGSFGGCARERGDCCTNEPARMPAEKAGGQGVTPGAHHLTPDNIAALIADMKACEAGGEFPSIFDRDWRTQCGVIWRVMEHLAGDKAAAADAGGLPEYTMAIGIAGDRYYHAFENAHPLPAKWSWNALWDAMRAATVGAGGQAQSSAKGGDAVGGENV